MGLATTLCDRIKEYENNTQTKLIKKLPVIIRLDGRSFSKFTKGFDKPFDIDINNFFKETTLEIRKEIPNAKFIYSQSDEISILLTDWDNDKQEDGGRIDTWYDYRIQKIVSVTSALATAIFNRKIYYRMLEYRELAESAFIKGNTEYKEKCLKKFDLLQKKLFKATFDARVFNLPVDEVVNYFIHRQQDALRNSISGFALQYYSTKQLTGINNIDKIEMIKKEYNIDFNEDITQLQKVGFTVITNLKAKDTNKDKFELDDNIPIFKENRDYIERYL